MDFWRTVSGLARLYPYFVGCAACVGLRITVLGFNGFKVMLGSRLVASCRTSACQHNQCESQGQPSRRNHHHCLHVQQELRPTMDPLLGPTPDRCMRARQGKLGSPTVKLHAP